MKFIVYITFPRWKAKKHCTGLLALLACNATGGYLGHFSSLLGSLAKISQNLPVWNSDQSCWTERSFLREQRVRRYALRAYRENPVADTIQYVLVPEAKI